MRSMWATYVDELLGGRRQFIECEWGFISYSFPDAVPSAIMIHDLYVVPELRRQNRGAELFEKVCEIGKERGKTAVIAEIELATAVAAESLKAHLAVGLVPIAAQNDKILTRKEIK